MGIGSGQIGSSFLRLLGNLEFGSRRTVNWRQQGKALTEGCPSLVFQSSGCVVANPDRTPFSGNFRIAGDKAVNTEYGSDLNESERYVTMVRHLIEANL
jgi:hypothetical protein